ncbi:hypothetical protein ACHAW6_009149 [Cyclotella cf. meneghiniana]
MSKTCSSLAKESPSSLESETNTGMLSIKVKKACTGFHKQDCRATSWNSTSANTDIPKHAGTRSMET